MKKIIMLIMFFFLLIPLVGCERTKLTNIVYVSSIGFSYEKEEDTMTAVFYLAPIRNITRTSGGEMEENNLLVIHAKSVIDIFYQAQLSLTTVINFKHIQSVVLHESFLETRCLEQFVTHIRNEKFLTYNFYVFATKNDLLEVFQQESPGELTELYNILNSPRKIRFEDAGVKKMMLIKFANLLYDPNRYMHIPLLVTKKVWREKKELVTNQLDGYVHYQDGIAHFFSLSDYPGLRMLESQPMFFLEEQESAFRIMKYRMEQYECNNTYYFHVKFQAKRIYGMMTIEAVEAIIQRQIQEYLQAEIQQMGSLCYIKQYNYLFQKRLNQKNYEIKVQCVTKGSVYLP